MNRPAPTSFEGVVQTREGPTFVKTIGRGPTVVVVHGGPGFDHAYLIPPLLPLADRRTLIFYDQPGCGRTPPPDDGLTPPKCFAHLRWLMDHFADGKPVGVIAHSWGALVLAGAASGAGRPADRLPEISEGVLVNPMPVSSAAYESARAKLIAMIPATVRIRATLLALLTGNGSAVMRLLLPYYMFDPAAVPARDFPLDLATYRKLDRQLKGFDYSADLEWLRNVTIFQGAHEFASPDDIADLIAKAASFHVIENAGHFPFWEARDEFQGLLGTAFPPIETS